MVKYRYLKVIDPEKTKKFLNNHGYRFLVDDRLIRYIDIIVFVSTNLHRKSLTYDNVRYYDLYSLNPEYKEVYTLEDLIQKPKKIKEPKLVW